MVHTADHDTKSFEFGSTPKMAISNRDSNTNPAVLDQPLMAHYGSQWWNYLALPVQWPQAERTRGKTRNKAERFASHEARAQRCDM